jgi:hypothetical protein
LFHVFAWTIVALGGSEDIEFVEKVIEYSDEYPLPHGLVGI